MPLMAALLVPFPLTSWLGVSAIALVGLRRGISAGLVGALTAGLAILLTAVHPVITASYLAEIAILLVCCGVLRNTERLELTLLWLVSLTAVFVLSLHQWGGVQLASYEKTLISAMNEVGLRFSQQDLSVRDWMLQSVVLGVSLKVLAGLLLGRWWQSRLFFPGAFGEAFLKLSISPVVASVLMILAFGVYLGKARYVFLSSLFLLPLVAMSAALVQSWVVKKQLNQWWLVGFYLLLPFSYLFAAVFAWANSLRGLTIRKN